MANWNLSSFYDPPQLLPGLPVSSGANTRLANQANTRTWNITQHTVFAKLKPKSTNFKLMAFSLELLSIFWPDKRMVQRKHSTTNTKTERHRMTGPQWDLNPQGPRLESNPHISLGGDGNIPACGTQDTWWDLNQCWCHLWWWQWLKSPSLMGEVGCPCTASTPVISHLVSSSWALLEVCSL